jgi:hypothetical protein
VIFFCFAAFALVRGDEGPAEPQIAPVQTAETPPTVGP